MILHTSEIHITKIHKKSFIKMFSAIENTFEIEDIKLKLAVFLNYFLNNLLFINALNCHTCR